MAKIRQILTCIDRSTPKGIRDAALILLGFAYALRRSELAALTLAGIETRPAGLLLIVRRSKGRGTTHGPLFTNMRNRRIGTRPITGSAVARMLKDPAQAAGLPFERITGRSLRAGRHYRRDGRRRAGPHRRPDPTQAHLHTLIEHYMHPAQTLDVTSSRGLGL